MGNDLSSPPSSTQLEKKIRVLLVDDHTLVRQGLRLFIEMQNDMEVIAEGSTGLDAIELAAHLEPDVILLDLIMPEMDGVEATREIMSQRPESHVLILTSFGEDDKVFPAIRAGALGYLLKDIQPRELVQSIREVYQGKAQLHPSIARRLMDVVSEEQRIQTEKPVEVDQDLQALTEREREVLELIARGMSNREIAGSMFISEKTVKTHVSNVLDKLALEDRTRAAIWALKHGLGS